MGYAKLYGQKNGSRMSIDGSVEKAYVLRNQTINAGDLVEYTVAEADQYSYTNVDTLLKIFDSAVSNIRATQLDKYRLLLTYCYQDVGDANKKLYGRICVITRDSIDLGEPIVIRHESTVTSYCPVLLINGNVFIAYSGGGTLCGLYLEIFEDYFIPHTPVVLDSSTDSGYHIGAVKLNTTENGVFIAHTYNSSEKYLYCKLVKIVGTVPTVLESKAVCSKRWAGNTFSICLKNSDYVCIAHDYDSANHYLYGNIVNAKDGTIGGVGTSVQLSSTTFTGATTSVLSFPYGSAMAIAYRDGANTVNYPLSFMTCSTSGTTVAKIKDSDLYTTVNSGSRIQMIHPNGTGNNNGMIIIHSMYSDYQIYATSCTIDTDSWKLKSTKNILLNSSARTAVNMHVQYFQPNVGLIIHSDEAGTGIYYQLFGIVNPTNSGTPTEVKTTLTMIDCEKQVKKATSTRKFKGVAKTGGTGGLGYTHKDLIEVYTKNYYKYLGAPTVFNTGTFVWGSSCKLNNGNIFITFQDRSTEDYFGGFVIYDQEGNLVKEKTIFNSAHTENTCVQTLANGNVMITFADTTSLYGSFVIYDQDGNLVKSKTVFNNASSSEITFEVLQNNNVLIAYRDNGNSYKGTFVIYDQDGNLVKSETVFESNRTESISIGVLNNGKVMICYEDRGSGESNWGKADKGTFVIYTSSGTVSRTKTVFKSGDVMYNKIHTQGNDVFIFYSDVNNSYASCFVKYDVDGLLLQDEVIYDTSTNTINTILKLRDGNFMVVFRANNQSSLGMFQIIDPNGKIIKTKRPFLGNQAQGTTLCELNNNNVFLAYSNYYPALSEFRIISAK